MDQRFHGALHFASRRGRHLAIIDLHRSLGHLGDCLLDDTYRLTHFLDPDEISVVGIAITSNRNIELDLVVSIVRLRSAEVPGDVGASQHGPGKSPISRLLCSYNSNVDGPLFEDTVFGQQPLNVIDRPRESVTEG